LLKNVIVQNQTRLFAADPAFYESHQDVQTAIAREKQIKRWRREKKIALIEKFNSRWQDLAENRGWEMRFRGQSLERIP